MNLGCGGERLDGRESEERIARDWLDVGHACCSTSSIVRVDSRSWDLSPGTVSQTIAWINKALETCLVWSTNYSYTLKQEC